MSMPSLEFLRDASITSLQDLLLQSLNRSANLSKAVGAELDAWIEEQAAAMVVRWMLENREKLNSPRIEPKRAGLLNSAEERKRA